jgi:hypothetical protein
MSDDAIFYNPRPGGLDPKAPHKKPSATPPIVSNPVPTTVQKALASAQNTGEEAKKAMESNKVGIPQDFPLPPGWKFADGGKLGNILEIKPLIPKEKSKPLPSLGP